MSHRMPHFNRESLEVELPKHGIAYVWLKELGGRRKKVLKDSPNTALRNESFRNYADYMMTEKFAEGIEELLAIADGTADPSTTHSPALQRSRADDSGERSAQDDNSNPGPSTSLKMTPEEGGSGGTAIMCAERLYFQCHRMLVSDYLTAHGHTVLHIDDEQRPVRQHTLMAEARLVKGKLVYDEGRLL